MLSINTNLSSLIAQRSMKQSTNSLNQAIERMTTGAKINHAKDNAANYNIATNMTTQIGSYEVAEDNTMTSLDLLTTASDSLALIQDRIQRLRDLQEQAMNGTYGEQSLQAINEECCALVDEINRVYETTEFNGISLFLEPTEMPDGTVAVVKETDAKLDTTFKDLGITATAFEIYDSDNNLIQAYDLDEEDAIQDFFDTLQTHGFSTELRNGVMNIQSTNLSYIEGDLATALGIQTKEIIDVSYTTETETIWTTTTSETTKTNTIFSTTTSTTIQTNTIYSTTTIESISTIPIEITTTNYVLTTNTLTVPSTIDEVAPLAESGGGFIQEVVRRDTSTMTALSSVDPNSELADGTYSISTTEEMLQLAEMVGNGLVSSSDEFVLANDIDFSDVECSVDTRIGSVAYPFYGKFDGNGYAVMNITMPYLSLLYYGVFGSIGHKGEVKNLGVENFNYNELDEIENSGVGFLAGENFGTIINCYAINSSMQGPDADGWEAGLAGTNCGTIISSYTDNCSFSASNRNPSFAGLVYVNTGKIQNCYAGGTITATNPSINIAGTKIGLLVYENTGTITNSYSKVTVSDENLISPTSVTNSDDWDGTEFTLYYPDGAAETPTNTTVTLNTTFAELGLSDNFQVKSSSGSLLVNVTGAMTLESFINSINSISGYNAELLNGVLLINSLEEVIGLESLNPQKSSNTSTISTTSIQTTTTEQVSTTTTIQTITTTSTSSVVDTQTLLVTTTSSTTNTTTLWSTSTVVTTQTMDKQTYKAIMENVYAPGEIGFLVGTNASPEQNISVNMAFKLDNISGLNGIGVDNSDYLSQIDSLLKKLAEKQVYYGAMQNRMMSVLEEISVKKENLVSSRSTLRDADISEVSSSYIQHQILQQASATLLSTANQSPSIALQLI